VPAALLFVLALALAGAAPETAGTPTPNRIALLPFDDFSGAEAARGTVAELVAAALEKKGYEVLKGEPIEQALEVARIRYLESLTAEARTKLLTEVGASGLVSGALYSWVDGDQPLVALSVRLVRADGTTAFANLIGLSADQTEGMLGLGRVATVEGLAREATSRLLKDLPAPGVSAKPRVLAGKPRRLPPPRTYRAAALAKGRVYRVCLLPVDNPTSVREASRDVSDVLGHRLAQSGAFDVVEPADLRAAMVAEKVRGFADMNPAALQRLGVRLGTMLFLRSSLSAFRPGSVHGGSQKPEIGLELQLVDVQTSRILWTAQHARRGDDYQFLFQRGAITDVVALADRTVSEMVDAFLNTRPTEVKTPAVSASTGEAVP
jgi:TolB-like protein